MVVSCIICLLLLSVLYCGMIYADVAKQMHADSVQALLEAKQSTERLDVELQHLRREPSRWTVGSAFESGVVSLLSVVGFTLALAATLYLVKWHIIWILALHRSIGNVLLVALANVTQPLIVVAAPILSGWLIYLCFSTG